MKPRTRWQIFGFVIMLVLLLSSCRGTGSILVFDEKTGYNFCEFLNQDQEILLQQLERQNIEYEEEKLGDDQSIYHLQGKLFGEATKLSAILFAGNISTSKADLYRQSLLFPTVENPTRPILYRYEEIVGLDYWPTETDEVGKKVIQLYDELIVRYGEPDFCSLKIGKYGIIGRPNHRQIVWNMEEDDMQVFIHLYGDKDSFHFDITYSSISGEQAQRERRK